jgi:hypothetical protein
MVDEKLQPKFSCTCPQGEDEKFCKHCTAFALALHEDSGRHIIWIPEKNSLRAPGREIARYVESLSHKILVGLVLDAATRDEVTARRLVTLEPTGSARTALDVKAWRAQITAAYGPKSQFIDYRSAPHWAHGILGIIQELRTAIDDGCASDTIGLLEHAFARTELAMEQVDDSDGWITMIAGEIGDDHLEACK